MGLFLIPISLPEIKPVRTGRIKKSASTQIKSNDFGRGIFNYV